MSFQVYVRQNRVNSKVYVGQTIHSQERRWQNCVSGAVKGYLPRNHFYNAIRKHGPEAFDPVIELWEFNSAELLSPYEQALIKQYDAMNPAKGYNGTAGREGTLSDGIRQRMSEAMKGKLIGSLNPFWGKKHTEETRQKMSESRKRRQRGETHPSVKLTEGQVFNMRVMHAQGVSQPQIAALFQISKSQVHNIVTGKHWSHSFPAELKLQTA